MTQSGSIALVADIGGTYARFALADISTREIREYRKYKVSECDSLEAAVTRYLASVAQRPVRACFAIAGPVGGEVIRLTNANWFFTRAGLRDATGAEVVIFANDYEALSHSLPYLTDKELCQIGGGSSVAQAARVAVGPGTGLGVAALSWSGAGWSAISGEGGHISFAVENTEEFEVFNLLRREVGHVSAERLISGPGLSQAYAVFGEMNGRAPVKLGAAEIVERARNGTDPVAIKTVGLFAEWLGRFAGDAALMFGARGGVYVAGGVAPRILDVLIAGRFRLGFESKGRMTDYMRRIPTHVILIEDAGLRGAAAMLMATDEDRPGA
ncbi:MAG: glucokinase [Aestuariivirga sp.]